VNSMAAVKENQIVHAWARHFSRDPNQANKPHESDAELIAHPTDASALLAITIDTVAEEIAEGIYRDPFTIGWVAVMASFSDIAAVGAEPLGIVISASVEPSRDEQFIGGVARGIDAACRACNTHVLGGDTNAAPVISLTGCALGVVPRARVMKRSGCRPGDTVYITRGAGSGNALGLARLTGMPDAAFPEELYRPQARLDAGLTLRDFASCCMDSSDGLLATLDQLMRINNCGFCIERPWHELLSPEVARFCTATRTPAWLMSAGPHGEFELVFAVRPEREAALLEEAKARGIALVRVGSVQERQAVSWAGGNLDVAFLRNLLYEVGGDLKRYLTEFLAFGAKNGLT